MMYEIPVSDVCWTETIGLVVDCFCTRLTSTGGDLDIVVGVGAELNSSVVRSVLLE